MIFNTRLPLFIFFFIIACSDSPRKTREATASQYYTQSNSNRVAAEWEPAAGTMIVWPLCIPHKLVIELAKDGHLYTLVANDSSKQEATEWYSKWGIKQESYSFITAPQGIDAWWVRDWGPSAVFTPQGRMNLADGKYIYSTPVTKLACNDELRFLYITADNRIMKTDTDDNATRYVCKQLNTGLLDLPFINTGGNVLTDGLGTAFSTCIVINENKYYGVSQNKFISQNRELLGIDKYNIISNFEKEGIQHIDCYMKLLDEERILVMEPPRDHELFSIYENIIQKELKNLKTPYGRPYEIIRISTGRYHQDHLAAYTNSLIVNKTIYVPLFRIKEDSAALKKWAEVMPGYTVKGFEFEISGEPILSPKFKEHYDHYGWEYGDALHCRVRAVWDSQMLFMNTKRIDAIVDSSHKNIIYTSIIDYSGKGLEPGSNHLSWRLAGEAAWNTISLNPAEQAGHYFAEIPYHTQGKTIEYYISATSKSGRKETSPRAAPGGTFQFRIK